MPDTPESSAPGAPEEEPLPPFAHLRVDAVVLEEPRAGSRVIELLGIIADGDG